MRPILFAPFLLAVVPAAFAQDSHHAGHPASNVSGGAAVAESTAAFEAANETMHRSMAVEFTGDADVDFVRSMIPHHQGAIDMARIVLQHGKDPELKALAEEIIAAQEAEIAEMDRWLEANAPNLDPDGAPAQ